MSIAASEGLTETVSEDTDCDLIERRFARQSQVIFSALKQSSDKNIELAAMLQGNLIMLHGQSGCDSAVLINILREIELTVRHSRNESSQAAIKIESVRRPLITVKRSPVHMLPSADSEEIGTLEKDSIVVAIGKVIDAPWYKIRVTEGVDGFIAQDGLTFDKGQLGREIAELEKQAEQGDIEAYYQLGNFMSRLNINGALAWWLLAAEQGHEGALYNIGVATLRGAFGKIPGKGDAIAWFQRAASTGHEKSQAILNNLLSQEQKRP